MPRLSASLNRQYGYPRLAEAVLAELERAGKNIKTLDRQDCVTFEEFHLRGRNATRELAKLADLQPGARLLDVGCGVGGPGRTLADEFGCQVIGMDMAWGYCRTARMLNALTRLEARFPICCAEALSAPFAGASFDVIWMQHVSMNIEDKAGLFQELRRLLKPGGRLALYEILAGLRAHSYFPLPWANTADISFLAEPQNLRQMLRTVGFVELYWEDVTGPTLEWGRRALNPQQPPPLGLDLVIGPDVGEKTSNLLRNLEEDRVRLVMAVAANSG